MMFRLSNKLYLLNVSEEIYPADIFTYFFTIFLLKIFNQFFIFDLKKKNLFVQIIRTFEVYDTFPN